MVHTVVDFDELVPIVEVELTAFFYFQGRARGQ